MAHFQIISSKTGNVLFEGTPKYVGTYLKPGYLEFSEIGSPTPIDWNVGDYVDYTRTGLRYYLHRTPKQAKQATAQKYGASFLYENVQFFDATKNLEVPFLDLVPGDNSIHFSTYNTVAFTGKVSNLAERIEASMNYWFPNDTWEVNVVTGLDSTDDAELIELLNTEADFSVSGASCQEALEKMYDIWNGIGWSYSLVSGTHTITIGAPNKRTVSNTTDSYCYGTGLTRLGRSTSNADEIGTRLYAYGSTKNTYGDYYRRQNIYNAESVDISHLMLPIQAASVGILPAGYTQLEYIEQQAGTSAYIKTGLSASNNIGFELDAVVYDAIGNTTGTFGTIFGGRYNTTYEFQISTYTNAAARKGSLRVGSTAYNANIVQNERFQATLSGTSYTCNGSTISVTRNLSNGREIYIFALNANGTVQEYGHGKIYSFKLYSSGTLVRNYIPCKNASNVVGLYDTVNSTFKSSANSATFTAGPEIGISYDGWGLTEGLPDASKAYIEASSSVIANLGLIPKYAYFDGSDDRYPEIYPSIEGVTIGDVRTALGSSSAQYYPSTTVYTNAAERVDEIKDSVIPPDNGTSTEGGSSYSVRESATFTAASGTKTVPANSSSEIVFISEYKTISSSSLGNKTVTISVILDGSVEDADFTATALRIRKHTESASQINDSVIYERDLWDDGSGDQSYSLPSPIDIVDHVLDGETVTYYVDASVTPESQVSERTFDYELVSGSITLSIDVSLTNIFSLRLKQIGFNLIDRASLGNGITISMKSGMCAGRDFRVKSCQYESATDSWLLTMYRSKDEDLGLLYPYSDGEGGGYPIVEGDRFVILDIAMPDIYITMAQNRLLKAAVKLLSDIDHEKPFYEPEIDAKIVYNESRVLREGMYMHLVADEIVDGGEDYVLIDNLEIDEGESNIPTYSVKLRQKKSVEWSESVSRGDSSRSSNSVDNSSSATATNTRNDLWLIQSDGTIKLNPRYLGAWAEGFISAGGLSTTAGGGTLVSSLKDLSDVDDNLSPSIGNIFKYNGSKWTSGAIALNDLSDVTISGTVPNGYALVYNNGVWGPGQVSGNISTLSWSDGTHNYSYNGSSATTITAAQLGALTSSSIKTLTINSGAFSAGTYNPVGSNNTTFTVPSAITHLSDASRVTSLENMWEVVTSGGVTYLHAKNSYPVVSDSFISGGGLSSGTGGSIVTYLKDLEDVSNSLNPSANQVLTYYNGQWTARNAQTGLTTLSLSGDVSGTLASGSTTIATSIVDGHVTNAKLANPSMTLWGQLATLGGTVTGNMSSVGKISFTAQSRASQVSDGNILEVVTSGGYTYLHSPLPIVSDSFITGGGFSSSGGGSTSISLDDLTDVSITGTPTTSQVIRYDGSEWKNMTLALSNLSDVTISGTPTTGYALVYRNGSWKPELIQSGGTGSTTIRNYNSDSTIDLKDTSYSGYSSTSFHVPCVSLSNVGDGDFLRYSQSGGGGDWVNSTVALADLSNVTISNPSTSHVLKYSSGSWVNGTLALADLSNVTGTPSNGQALVYDSTNSTWKPETISGGSSTLAGLTDTNISEYPSDKFLFHNGTKWVDTFLFLESIRDVVFEDEAEDGEFLGFDGEYWRNMVISLGALSNVNTTGATDGQALVYNSTSQTWVPRTVGGGGSSVSLNVRESSGTTSANLTSVWLDERALSTTGDVAVMFGGDGSLVYGRTYHFPTVTISSSTLQDGQVLAYDATNHVWVNSNSSGGSSVSIDDLLSDGTTIATLTIDGTDYTIKAPSGGGSGGTTTVRGYNPNNCTVDIKDTSYSGYSSRSFTLLTDVSINSPSDGEVLVYDSGYWVNGSGGGGGSYSGGTGITVSGSTISLDKATSLTIGGVKPANVSTSAITHTTASSGTYYGVTMDKNGKLVVRIPSGSGGSFDPSSAEDIIPASDVNYDLGSSVAYWNRVYASEIHLVDGDGHTATIGMSEGQVVIHGGALFIADGNVYPNQEP